MPTPGEKTKILMMLNKLKTDSIQAVKGHNQSRVDVLRYLISLIDKRALQLPPGTIAEAEEMSVLRKELKNKEESRELFVKAGRDDLVKQLDYEIGVVKEYLPEEMDDTELEKIIDEALRQAQGGTGNIFGEVMKIVMMRVAGRVGGEKIAPLVKKKLETGN
jgi:uncharacterized protein